MKKCPFCKADIEDDARFCVFCMSSLEEKQIIEIKQEKTKRWLYIIAAFLLLVIIILFLVIALSKNKPNNNSGMQTSKSNTVSTNNSSGINSVLSSDTADNDDIDNATASVKDETNGNTAVENSHPNKLQSGAIVASSKENSSDKTTTSSGKKTSSNTSKNANYSSTNKTSSNASNKTSTTTSTKTSSSVLQKTSNNPATNSSFESKKENLSTINKPSSTFSSSSSRNKVQNSNTPSQTSSTTSKTGSKVTSTVHSAVNSSGNVTSSTSSQTSSASSQSTVSNTEGSSKPNGSKDEISQTEVEYIYRTAKYGDDYSVAYRGDENDIVITGVRTASKNGTYIIPEQIDGKRVIAIMPLAFCDKNISDTVKKLVIPSTVKTIWDRAFAICYNLTDIYFCGNSLYTYSSAFADPVKRAGTLTIHCSTDCNNRDFRNYKNIADSFYSAQYKEWNGGEIE